MDWNLEEVQIIVADYFAMLSQELANKPYSKAAHRTALMPLLNNRSAGSIEFKHQNISAVLVQMGLPFIKGYKPRYNYQQLLVRSVTQHIGGNQRFLEKEFEKFSDKPVEKKAIPVVDFHQFLTEEVIVSRVKDDAPLYRPIKINYLEKEQHNRSLGIAGEELIIEYEKWRLGQAGKESLGDRVEWVSKEQGDGTGFDILSKNNSGTDRYIEVKTTKLSKETPIYLTNTEVSFATLKKKDFFLYRVYDFESEPKFFMRNGEYKNYCEIIPQSYKGYFF
jgi:hypothetical protein